MNFVNLLLILSNCFLYTNALNEYISKIYVHNSKLYEMFIWESQKHLNSRKSG
jgi:hypothetical protein